MHHESVSESGSTIFTDEVDQLSLDALAEECSVAIVVVAVVVNESLHVLGERVAVTVGRSGRELCDDPIMCGESGHCRKRASVCWTKRVCTIVGGDGHVGCAKMIDKQDSQCEQSSQDSQGRRHRKERRDKECRKQLELKMDGRDGSHANVVG